MTTQRLPVVASDLNAWGTVLNGYLLAAHRADGGLTAWYDVKSPTYGAVGDGVADDTTAIQAAITAAQVSGGVVFLPPGSYKTTSAINLNTKASLLGSGSVMTSLIHTGSGDCLRVQQSPFANNPAVTIPGETSLKLSGFTIDGSGAGSAAVGLHYGDVVGGELNDLVIQHYTGATAIGLWMQNATNFTERTTISRTTIRNNKIGIKWTKNNADDTTVSFGYNRLLDVKFTINNGQTGMSFQSASGGALSLYNGLLNCNANMAGTSTFIELTGNAQVRDCLVDVVAEGPATCTFITIPGTAIWRTVGVMIPGRAGGEALMTVTGNIQGFNAGYQNASIGPLNPTVGGPGGGTRASLQIQNGASAWLASLYQDGSSVLGLANGGVDCLSIDPTTKMVSVLSGALSLAKDLRHSQQSLAYASTVTPDATAGEAVVVGALTGNITIGAPTNPATGQYLVFVFTQDSTGGRTVTWNAAFRTNWQPSTVASARNTITFSYDGSTWNQISTAVGL